MVVLPAWYGWRIVVTVMMAVVKVMEVEVVVMLSKSWRSGEGLRRAYCSSFDGRSGLTSVVT